jgi:hypothetical protein
VATLRAVSLSFTVANGQVGGEQPGFTSELSFAEELYRASPRWTPLWCAGHKTLAKVRLTPSVPSGLPALGGSGSSPTWRTIRGFVAAVGGEDGLHHLSAVVVIAVSIRRVLH